MIIDNLVKQIKDDDLRKQIETEVDKGMFNIEKTKKFKKKYDSILQLLKDLFEAKLTKKEFVYRGISKSDEQMPNITRVISQQESTNSINFYEYKFLYHLYRLGRPLLKSSNSNCLEIAALAQHYGIPTRLLDWTKDPFVALFFAINNNPVADDVEYTIFYADLKENTFFDHYSTVSTDVNDFIIEYKSLIDLISEEESLKKAIKRRQETYEKIKVFGTCQYRSAGKLIFYDAPFTNERILAQKGLFSIPRSIKYDDAKNEIGKVSKFTIDIKEEDRQKLVDFLENMQYTKATLFPELASLAEHVRGKITFNP